MAKGSLRVNGIIVDTDGEIKASTGDSIVIREDDGSAVITVDTNGKTSIGGPMDVGVDDTGHDVKFFGATAGAYMLWDESQDDLIVGGAGRVGIGTTAPGNLLNVVGTADNAVVTALQLENTDYAAAETGQGVMINFRLSQAGTAQQDAAQIIVGKDSAWHDDAARDAHIAFKATVDATMTEHMRIQHDGKVGIGTTAPDSLLEIRGSAAEFKIDDTNSGAQITLRGNVSSDTTMGQLSFYNNTDNDTLAAIRVNREGANDAANITFYTQATSSNNAERMRIDSTGKVGIGTTAPASTLHVNGANAGIRIEEDTDNDYMLLDMVQGGRARITTSDSRILCIQEDGGNVGIGTTSPGKLLHLYGASTQGIRIGVSGQSYYHDILSNGDGLLLSADTSDAGGSGADIRFNVGNSEKMRIKESGNVGIASTAPTQKLDVGGTAKASKIVGRGEQESSSGYQSDTFCVEGVNTTNGSTSHGAVFASKHTNSFNLICGTHDATFNNFRVRADGRIFANNLGAETSHTGLAVRSSDGMIVRDTSSRRYKSNIVDTTIDSTLISNIQVRDFTWTETGNDYVGLIAEEVNEHIPKAVVKATENGETVCEAISWPTLTSLLIDYSQKLEERISQLESAG